MGGKDYNWTISNVCDLMGFKGDRRSNVFIGDFPAELPIFNAYRKSLSLEFKMDLGLEMAAKMFLRTVRNLQNNHIFLLIYEYLAVSGGQICFTLSLRGCVNGSHSGWQISSFSLNYEYLQIWPPLASQWQIFKIFMKVTVTWVQNGH